MPLPKMMYPYRFELLSWHDVSLNECRPHNYLRTIPPHGDFIKMIHGTIRWRKKPSQANSLFTSPDETNVRKKVLLIVLPISVPQL